MPPSRIREVISTNILFSGLDARERDIIVDAMEPKSFEEVRWLRVASRCLCACF